MSDSTVSTQSIKYRQTQHKATTLPATTNVTNINAKRVKVTLACVVCRKKKVKCDGIQPSCSRCNSMGISCEYSDPPKKRGPPKGQVEIIESRARRIESLRVANGMSETHTVSPAPVAHGANGFAQIGDFFNNGDNTLFLLENNTVVRLISGAVDAVEMNKYPSSSLLDQQETPGSHYIKNDFFMKDDSLADGYQKWTCSYFGHFNVFFPLLSQPHYMQQLSQQKVDPLLFYAVCAIGSKYSDDDLETSRLLFERCQYFLNMSRDSTTLSTVQALVLLCWYGYLLAKMETCGELRQRLNQAVNDLQLYRDPSSSLGVVSIEMYRRAFWVAFVTDQWFSCCTGERFLILPHGRNCQQPQLEDSQLLVIGNKQWCISDNNHDDMVHTQQQKQQQQQQQQLNDSPDSLSHFMPDLSAEYALQITAFAEMIKLACIVDEMHDLYAPSSKLPNWHHQQVLVSRLTHWLVHLPSYLEYGKPKDDAAPSPIARIYHILYYTVQIMLHQPYLQEQQPLDPMIIKSVQASPAPAPDILMARSICTNAANTIVHISEQMIRHNQHMYLHSTFMISLTLASSVQLDNVIHSDQAHGVSSLLNLGKSFDVLKNCNCSVLSPVELDQLLNRFLLDHYGIRMGGKQRTLYQPIRSTCRASCVKKRTLATVMDDCTPTDSNDRHYVPRHRKRRQHTTTATQPSCTTDILCALYSLTKMKKDTDTITNRSHQDDLLDTRLYHLLSQDAQQPYTTSAIILSPSTSSSASNVLDPLWLDETSSILDLFPEAPPPPPPPVTSLPSPQCYASDSNSSSPSKISGYATTPVDSLFSPVSFISPTQSPTLSSTESNPYTTMTIHMVSNTSSSYSFNDYGTDYLKSPDQYGYLPPPPPPVTMDIFAFMSDAASSLPHSSLTR